MDELIREFENKLRLEGKSDTTIKSYITSVNVFFRWFNDSFGEVGFKKLYRENILEYKSYLKNVRTSKRTGQNLNAKSINVMLSGLIKYNELMQPDNIVISKADLIKVQAEIISPTNITKKEVEEFRQRVLQSEGCSAKTELCNSYHYGLCRITNIGSIAFEKGRCKHCCESDQSSRRKRRKAKNCYYQF